MTAWRDESGNPTVPTSVPVKGTKAVVAAIGSVATAVTTAATALAVFASDDAIDFNEISGILAVGAALVGTVVGVYKTYNAPKQ